MKPIALKARKDNAQNFRATDIQFVCNKVRALGLMPLWDYFGPESNQYDNLKGLLPVLKESDTYQTMCCMIASMPQNTDAEKRRWADAVYCVTLPISNLYDRLYSKCDMRTTIEHIRRNRRVTQALSWLTLMDLRDFYVACDKLGAGHPPANNVANIYTETFYMDEGSFGNLMYVPTLAKIKELHEEYEDDYLEDYVWSEYQLLIRPFSMLPAFNQADLPKSQSFADKYRHHG